MKPLSHVLYSMYKGQPHHGQWIVACLQGSWAKILGERLAAICRPASFKDSELGIELIDPAWDQAIQSVKPALLEKLRSATANEVRSIRFSRLEDSGEK